jgi:hypothetical protein
MRYEVFHLPALFVVHDGQFYGALQSPLHRAELTGADTTLSRPAGITLMTAKPGRHYRKCDCGFMV